MRSGEVKSWFVILLVASVAGSGAVDITAPVGGVPTTTMYPFLINYAGLKTMRYQQVYNSSLFSNLDGNIYLRSMLINGGGWSVSNIQVNLSTTSKGAGNLSSVFSENVGLDDRIVLGPGAYGVPSSAPDGIRYLFFDRAWRYNPALGNLLLDVRIFDSSGPIYNPPAYLNAFNSPTNGVSRVWSTNVTALVADGMDNVGVQTDLIFGTDFFLTVSAPSRPVTSTYLPFLIQQTYPYIYPSSVPVSIRYQQVYSSALFTNLDPGLIYLTALTFTVHSLYTNQYIAWAITNLQMSLSTTTNAVGNLSPVFSNNIGPDNVIVFNRSNGFSGCTCFAPAPWTLYLDRPLHYDPTRGNLLMDVSFSTASGQNYANIYDPWLAAFDSPPGEVSRVWSTNMNSSVADAIDGRGLNTIFRISPIPSLRADFLPFICVGCPTNVIQISWPSQPSIFQLQQADSLGANAVWRNVPTSQILGDATGGGWFLQTPATSAAALAYYRLIWPGGH